eukprot:1161015-Pelagomonas_calceolata.AAC.4
MLMGIWRGTESYRIQNLAVKKIVAFNSTSSGNKLIHATLDLYFKGASGRIREGGVVEGIVKTPHINHGKGATLVQRPYDHPTMKFRLREVRQAEKDLSSRRQVQEREREQDDS